MAGAPFQYQGSRKLTCGGKYLKIVLHSLAYNPPYSPAQNKRR
jgi:hypothetical protein